MAYNKFVFPIDVVVCNRLTREDAPRFALGMLICPVRDCRLPLGKTANAFRCERGHSFDIARSGYLNLLQPQDRRSREPGDTPAAVRARRRLHDLGITAPLLHEISALLAPRSGEHLLDAGCGEGFYAGSLSLESGILSHGVDISATVVEAAARRYPACEWIVANADRFLPYADRSFSAVMSITGRRNPPEFHRVLEIGGRLLLAVPAPDDLIELRGPQARDRVPSTLAEFSPLFRCEAHRRATTSASLEPDAIQDLLLSVYRPAHSIFLAPATLTFSLDLLLLHAV